MWVEPTHISTPQSHAMAVEKFKALDSDFAAVIKLVAELRRAEFAVRGLTVRDRQCTSTISATSSGEKNDRAQSRRPSPIRLNNLSNAPHVGLAEAELYGDIADARRPEALARCRSMG